MLSFVLISSKDTSQLAPATMQGCVNMLSGLNVTRHPVAKAARPAPASQTNSVREHSVCAIKPLKSVRGSPTRLSLSLVKITLSDHGICPHTHTHVRVHWTVHNFHIVMLFAAVCCF